MRSEKNILLFLLLAGLAIAPGCSSSPTSSGDDYLDMGNSPESSADSVGSIPEDMLANDEAAGDGEMPAPVDGSADATTDATTDTDAFADLHAEDGGAAAMTVSEESTSQTSGTTDTYTVKPGDTLMKIAFTIYGDIERWKDLRDWNQAKVKNNGQLKVGTKLTYETPLQPFNAEELSRSYVIKQGDTLAGIADEVYGRRAKYRKLQNYNKSLVKNPHRIFAGFTLFYDITDQEMAEAEARRQEKMAGGGGMSSGSSAVSSVAPAPSASAANDDFNLLPGESTPPSAISPPTSAVKPSAPVASFPPVSSQPVAPPSSAAQ